MLATLLLAAAATPLPPADQQRFKDCAALASLNPDKAVAEAEAWRSAGGGLLAKQCAGLAYVAS